MSAKCWITVGFRQSGQCSACGKTGEHREIRFNGSGYPTPCVWALVCNECWADNTKYETSPLLFPPERSHQITLSLG